jgi:hypothetical protein
MNNLKQIVLALHNYESTYQILPNGIKDEQGQLLLSWRVQILPYLEQGPLFQKFKLDEPWDSPHNKPLLAHMPGVFKVGIEPEGSTDTYYQMFTGVGTICDHTTEVRLHNIPDGTSNTLAVAEIGPPVPWSKPADVPYSMRKALPVLRPPFKNVWFVGMADGSVRGLRPVIDPINLRRLVERADGEVIEFDKLHAPIVPVTDEEKKEGQALLDELAVLRTKKTDLVKQRELLRAELASAYLHATGSGPGLDLVVLEREKQQLLNEMQAIRAEIQGFTKSLQEVKEGMKK